MAELTQGLLDHKTFDNVLQAVFERGVAFGSRYPELEAIPDAEMRIQLRAWRAHLTGNTWTVDEWLKARMSEPSLAVGQGQPPRPEPEQERFICAEKWYGEGPRIGEDTWPCGAAITDVFHKTHVKEPTSG